MSGGHPLAAAVLVICDVVLYTGGGNDPPGSVTNQLPHLYFRGEEIANFSRFGITGYISLFLLINLVLLLLRMF